jgi:hypothetical protein
MIASDSSLTKKGMTTLAAWVGVDQRGPASIYLAADSRMTWSSEKWDFGRKLFASRSSSDIIGYCGDAFFPTQLLGQIIELIDRGLIVREGGPLENRLQWIVNSVERSAKKYPRSVSRDFELLYGNRQGEGIDSSFGVWHIRFCGGRAAPPIALPIPPRSGLLETFGTGKAAFKEVLREWQASDIGGTSRAVFSAFSDHLQRGSDPSSGGAPQLIGLYRTGAAKTFGIVWNESRFISGMEVPELDNGAAVRWHNNLFEICDASSLGLATGAQSQPRPRNLDRKIAR